MKSPEFCRSVFGSSPVRTRRVGGGCIAVAFHVELKDGRSLFVKTLDGAGDVFAAEALGLQHLAAAGGVRVPKVLHVSRDALYLEWIDFRSPPLDFQAKLGRSLAQTHRHSSESFGFDRDHVIGSTPQRNTPRLPAAPGAWIPFWREYRLEPMIRRLPASLAKRFSALESRVELILSGSEEAPSLLHGDLWSGNVACDTEGEPVIFDPAAYYGHREADLSMTRMFGGFTTAFYDAYREAFPLRDGWQDRLDFYRLYHVLNHVILFGNSYLPQAESLLRRFG